MKERLRKRRNIQNIMWDLVWTLLLTLFVTATFELGLYGMLACPFYYGLLLFHRVGKHGINDWYKIESQKEDP